MLPVFLAHSTGMFPENTCCDGHRDTEMSWGRERLEEKGIVIPPEDGVRLEREIIVGFLLQNWR